MSRRVNLLAQQRWGDLLAEAARAGQDQNAQASASQRRLPGTGTDGDLQRRAERAAALAHLGELSAASAALEAAPLAPATLDTVAELRDPAKRPQSRQVPLPPWLAEFDAPALLAVDAAKLSANLLRARRGAAAGPSGATCEHMRVLLHDEDCCELLHNAAQCLARAEVPEQIAAGLRLDRMVALQKPAGGIRALVMGDVFRRLVSRTLAQQFIQRPIAGSLRSVPIRFDHESRHGSAGACTPLCYGVQPIYNSGQR